MSWVKIGALFFQFVNWLTRRVDINEARELERLRLEKEGREDVEDIQDLIDSTPVDGSTVSDDEITRP
jgi:hypothetical protein